MPEHVLQERDLRSALKGRRVLVTGHTGFKGAWLCLWLRRLGAHVTGIALPPPEGPSLFESVGLNELVDSRFGDIRSPESFAAAVDGVDADLVLHLAAQALVRPSYDTPVDTYLTNVVGTAVVLDAARRMPSLRAAIVVTSDKCYENREWVWGYRETDEMGGHDPYSSSKGCTELVVSAYRRSFFNNTSGPFLASVRAGNVIGGGDWGVDRLVPDIIRAAIAHVPVDIRNPCSTRPWQHVLEPLSGYLAVAAHLLSDHGARFAEAWNFGPESEADIDVRTLAEGLCEAWGADKPELKFAPTSIGPHEATRLRLDSTKARSRLGWRPRLSAAETVRFTAEWYRAYATGTADLRALTEAQIRAYWGEDEALPAALPPLGRKSGDITKCA